MTQNEPWDVLIIGAGAAGVGCGVVLRDLGLKNYALLERHEVGASFKRWPAEMRFISPSFTGNAFGMVDLNAVTYNTSPAYTLNREHPSGLEYAHYLQATANHFELPVQTGVAVHGLKPLPDRSGFEVLTSAGPLTSRFVIWAAGEFQYPNLDPFPGAEFCRHNAQVRSWREIEGEEALIIGGYESGIDAAINLVKLGVRVRVLDGQPIWNNVSSDPSICLSTYTRSRLNSALKTERLELIGDVWISRVEHQRSNGYTAVGSEDGRCWNTAYPPILATGFDGSLSLIANLFDWSDEGYARLTAQDESTLTPGLFLVGPNVRHGKAIFCFIYKFRQRFAVVAQTIGERLGLDTTSLELYRRHGMFLDDLSCCGDTCAC